MSLGAHVGDTTIAGLTCDSRRVRPGFLFAALPGSRADGRDFVDDALARGAAAVLAPEGSGPLPAAGVPVVTDANPRRRYALMAAGFFARQPETVVAVTGTNGKTSVVAFARQIWARLGHPAASLGTLGVNAPGLRRDGSLTTPDPVELHETLAGLADGGVTRAAVEASSHGLAQYRLDGVRLAAGAFTTLGRDHLDYHGSMDAYRDAKLRLFAELVETGGAAVVNADAEDAGAVAAAAGSRGLALFTYGRRGREVRLEHAAPDAAGQALTVVLGGRRHRVSLPLVGGFQAANALCALALVLAAEADADVDVDAAVASLAHLDAVPGRMQRVATLANGAAAYVDYAHTPDALAAVLDALRPHAASRLVVVFGCGGDRDAGKRAEMGAIAGRLADAVTVTDDNPRTEDPAAIRRAIVAACPGAVEIGDRAEAIAAVVAGLGAGDVLVVAGKGHETGQIVGESVLPFDDAEAVRAAVAEAGR